jgi:hypothetical protein
MPGVPMRRKKNQPRRESSSPLDVSVRLQGPLPSPTAQNRRAPIRQQRLWAAEFLALPSEKRQTPRHPAGGYSFVPHRFINALFTAHRTIGWRAAIRK